MFVYIANLFVIEIICLQYIASFYHEDPESYNNEILKLERLRRGATCATEDITSCQTLKEYYCQLHFLKSRFPLEEGQPCAIYFTWYVQVLSILNSIFIQFCKIDLAKNLFIFSCPNVGRSFSKRMLCTFTRINTNFNCTNSSHFIIRRVYYKIHFLNRFIFKIFSKCLLKHICGNCFFIM